MCIVQEHFNKFNKREEGENLLLGRENLAHNSFSVFRHKHGGTKSSCNSAQQRISGSFSKPREKFHSNDAGI